MTDKFAELTHVVEDLGPLDPQLPVVRRRELRPGELVRLRGLAYDEGPVLASAGRGTRWVEGSGSIRFSCEAVRGVQVVSALCLAIAPTAVRSGESRCDAESGVLWLQHPGDPAGTAMELSF
ncbi:hypothetical protein GCM10009804_16970 [Kribbella hippodromi]|uniref:Uncharacterized protein n=1 Tax=Kribbella hippodromi TaxID=434347 RepID=A0ABP4NKG5_9ACTN